jgi:hypothetical protein
MYEMQGPGPVFGRWPAGCPAGVLVNRPSAGTGYPREAPVSRFFLRSGVAPGVVPVSGSEVFLLPGTPAAQEFRALISTFFRCPQGIHSDGGVVPRSRHFSTRPSTTSSTGGGRRRGWSTSSASTCHRWCSATARRSSTWSARRGWSSGRSSSRRGRRTSPTRSSETSTPCSGCRRHLSGGTPRLTAAGC